MKNQVQVVREKAVALVANIADEKALAEEKLEAAKPALEEAESALNTIKPAHIATVRKLGRPPHLIMRIMDCVLILFQRRVHPVFADTNAPCPKPSWQESLKVNYTNEFHVTSGMIQMHLIADDGQYYLPAATAKLPKGFDKRRDD